MEPITWAASRRAGVSGAECWLLSGRQQERARTAWWRGPTGSTCSSRRPRRARLAPRPLQELRVGPGERLHAGVQRHRSARALAAAGLARRRTAAACRWWRATAVRTCWSGSAPSSSGPRPGPPAAAVGKSCKHEQARNSPPTGGATRGHRICRHGLSGAEWHDENLSAEAVPDGWSVTEPDSGPRRFAPRSRNVRDRPLCGRRRSLAGVDRRAGGARGTFVGRAERVYWSANDRPGLVRGVFADDPPLYHGQPDATAVRDTPRSHDHGDTCRRAAEIRRHDPRTA